MQFQEGKRIKAVEGIPVEEAEMLKDVEKHAHHVGEEQQRHHEHRLHLGKRKEKQGQNIAEKSVNVSNAS